MELTEVKKIYGHAIDNNYAIPATNFINQEMLEAYVQAAEELNFPLILAFAEAHSEYISIEEAAILGRFYAERSKVPIILHFDHGQSLDSIKKAINLGFNSVMIDASSKSFDENVNITKSVVDYAHLHNVFVEAEIGHVGSGNVIGTECSVGGDDSIYTDAKEAFDFVRLTNVDSLAISIGTSHGTYIGEPKISIERLKEINNIVDIPLVLHGGSSSGDENLRECALNGIRKINIYTDFLTSAYESLKNSDSKNYYEYKFEVKNAIKNKLIHYYKVFNTKELN